MGYGHVWTEQKVRDEILRCKDALMIDRMPTADELKSLGRNDLHIKISRTKKYSGWAEELGLMLKACDTRTGHKYERIIKEKLEALGYTVESMTTRHPYDLFVNECLKVDVKASKAHFLFGSRAHTFGISKENPTCDIYICVAINEQDEIEKILVVPSHFLRMKTLNLCTKSKWNDFLERWDYIKMYTDFYKTFSNDGITH